MQKVVVVVVFVWLILCFLKVPINSNVDVVTHDIPSILLDVEKREKIISHSNKSCLYSQRFLNMLNTCIMVPIRCFYLLVRVVVNFNFKNTVFNLISTQCT